MVITKNALGVAKASERGDKTFSSKAQSIFGRVRTFQMIHMRRHPTREIAWRDLFKNPRLFPAPKSIAKRQFPASDPTRRPSFYSRPGRYGIHTRFLSKHADKIRVFADVGCSFPRGAPTTIDAKNALGEEAEVYAIDHLAPKPEEEARMIKAGLIVKIHEITREPLPFQCDAIRFANVSYYMTQSDRRRALVNIWKSLKDKGYLLGAFIGKGFILRKNGRRFELIYPRRLELL